MKSLLQMGPAHVSAWAGILLILMNRKIKRKWIAALRSGQYKQCRGMIRNGYKEYCALGILLYEVAGGSEELGKYKAYDTLLKRIALLNDSCLWNFHQIAEYLENDHDI